MPKVCLSWGADSPPPHFALLRLGSFSARGVFDQINAVYGINGASLLGWHALFDNPRPPGTADRDRLVVKVVFRMMHICAIAVTHKYVGTGALFQHIGKILSAHCDLRLATGPSHRRRNRSRKFCLFG